MFIQNKDDVYRDMIIGVHQRPGDLHVSLPLRCAIVVWRYSPVLNCVAANFGVTRYEKH
jgi:hypothetical protein